MARYQHYVRNRLCPDDSLFVQELIFHKECTALPTRHCFARTAQHHVEVLNYTLVFKTWSPFSTSATLSFLEIYCSQVSPYLPACPPVCPCVYLCAAPAPRPSARVSTCVQPLPPPVCPCVCLCAAPARVRCRCTIPSLPPSACLFLAAPAPASVPVQPPGPGQPARALGPPPVRELWLPQRAPRGPCLRCFNLTHEAQAQGGALPFPKCWVSSLGAYGE